VAQDTWLKLWRKSLDSAVFADANLWKVWCWCLMKANHKITHVPVSTGRGNTIVTLTPGQFIYGRAAASKALKMPGTSVEGRLAKLINTQNLVRQSVSHYSVITIVNWARYNGQCAENGQGTRQATVRQPSGNRQATVTDKNVKKVQKVKKKDVRILSRPAAGAAVCPVELRDLVLYADGEQDGHTTRQRGILKLWRQWPTLKAAWEQSYPAVRVLPEVRKAHAWELAHPAKRKVDRIRFLGTWLARQQDRGGSTEFETEADAARFAWPSEKKEGDQSNGSAPS